jgi:23S rRNA (guanosine2251-2'-O)-methyltransferase
MRFLGPHACEEALERGELQTLRVAPVAWERCAKLRLAAREQGVVVHREPMDSLDRRSQGQRHQGVLGEGEAIALASMEQLLARVRERGSRSLVLALDGISDPHNFGAILRSAAGAGADGVVFPERRSAQVNETVMRSSAGTAGRVPLVRVVNLARALEDLKEAGAWVYGLAAGAGSRDYLEEPFDRSTVLVLGSEGEGLHQKITEHCDGLLRIDMPGGIESLNVSSAAAVMLFRVLAQRRSLHA